MVELFKSDLCMKLRVHYSVQSLDCGHEFPSVTVHPDNNTVALQRIKKKHRFLNNDAHTLNSFPKLENQIPEHMNIVKDILPGRKEPSPYTMVLS